ncbi:hypothetical protein MKW92_011758 [Papaver armeniacum]|nr:hypothetical protein MKW92_011758 [Papaver armeniacum]
MDNEFIWELEKAEDGILKPALLLSYYDLPPAVRACFVYCAIFPKGHEIREDELIGMWMAQGLIVSTAGSGGEAVGREYFNRLAARSFFQNFEQDLDGNIINCDMHDLVHDFAQFLTQGEYVTLSDTSSNKQSLNPRHLSFFGVEDSFNPDSILSSIYHGEKNLRTFLVLNRYSKHLPFQLKTMLPDLLPHLRYLRVLTIRNSDLECLPTEIGKLIHLRFLDLCYNVYLTELPDSLCSLYNLQTLDVSHCPILREFPEELGRMINLRHLRFENNRSLGCLPQGIGNLISLHTLREFRIRVAGGSSIKLLKKLNQLEGHLSISGLDLIQSSEDAYEAMLSNKKNLQSLRLDFAVTNIESEDSDDEDLDAVTKIESEHSDDEDFEIAAVETVVDVFASLEPPSLLRKLKIMNYRGSKFSNWIAMLPNLRRLKLHHCNCVELPALGNLPSLEHLSILDMHKLKQIGPEFYGVDGHRVAFPQLKTLRISEAHGLEHFTVIRSRGFDIFPLLHQVDLDDCINLKALPAFGKLPSLEYLDISGLHNVKHIGTEFYGDGGGYADTVPFPKLKTLRIEGAQILEEWDPFVTEGAGFDVMPCLGELELRDCGLKALPALGKLPLLKVLSIKDLNNLKHIGSEFYGVGGEDHANRVAFPELEALDIWGADSLEEWGFGAEECGDHQITIMPCLRQVSIYSCGALKKFPALGKLQSLETLWIIQMNSLKEIGDEFYGGGSAGGNNNFVSFPNLIYLRLDAELEQWAFGTDAEEEKSDAAAVNMIRVMPRVRHIDISRLKLKTLPAALGKLPCLERLEISGLDNVERIGPEFYGLRTDVVTTTEAVFPKLYELHLSKMQNLQWWEPGSSMCIMPCLRDLYITNCSYLKSLPQHLSNTLVSLSWYNSNSKIPPRLGQLEALQHLYIGSCSWEYMPTEIQDMHNLRTLQIDSSKDLEENCTGDGRKIISHIPNIRIGNEIICGHF